MLGCSRELYSGTSCCTADLLPRETLSSEASSCEAPMSAEQPEHALSSRHNQREVLKGTGVLLFSFSLFNSERAQSNWVVGIVTHRNVFFDLLLSPLH